MPIAWSAIQTALVDMVALLTQIPAAQVRWGDQNHPEDIRPFASLALPSSPAATVTQAEIRNVLKAQVRTFQVVTAADQTYTITLLGTPFAHVSVSETVTQIRDELVVLVNGGVEATALASGADALVVTAATVGINLKATTSPDPDLVELTVGPFSLPTQDHLEVQSFAIEELEVEITISSRYNDGTPLVTDHARTLAAKVKAGVWLPTAHGILAAAHCPVLRTGPVLDLSALLGADFDTRATVDLVCAVPAILAEEPGTIETVDVVGTFTS